MTITTDVAGIDLVEVPAWRPFRVWVSRLQRLSPTFLRITFTGGDLDQLGHDGPDQRIKVYLPRPGHGLPEFPTTDWHAAYRAADPATRGALRTYTIRAVRPEQREVDIDFVLHGDTSPASAFAVHAQIGQEVALVGPNRQFGGDCQGYEWKPPAGVRTTIIAGDETAVPAICGILDSLRSRPALPTRTHVLLEVPDAADALHLPALPGVEITWLSRRRADGSVAPHGQLLVDAVCGLDLDAPMAEPSHVDTIDIDLQLLWEIAAADDDAGDLYAWVAGEAGTVKAIRRHLVRERGIDRKAVTFMGYWKLGRSEN